MERGMSSRRVYSWSHGPLDISLVLMNIVGKEPGIGVFHQNKQTKKRWTVQHRLAFSYSWIDFLQTWYDDEHHLILHFFFTSVWMTSTFVQSHIYVRKIRTFVLLSSEIFQSIWMKFIMLWGLFSLLELLFLLFIRTIFKEENPAYVNL